jgi:hypothetical protein
MYAVPEDKRVAGFIKINDKTRPFFVFRHLSPCFVADGAEVGDFLVGSGEPRAVVYPVRREGAQEERRRLVLQHWPPF